MWHTGCSPGGLALPPVGATLVPAPETLTVHPVGLGPMPLGGQLTHGPTLSPCSSLPARPSFPSAQLDLYLELKWSLHRAAHWHWPELVGWTEMPAPCSTRPGHDYQVSDMCAEQWFLEVPGHVCTHLAACLQDGGPSHHQLCLSWVGWDRTAEPPFSGFPGPHGALHFLATLSTSCQSLAGSWETWVNMEQSCPERPLEAPLTIWSVNEAPTPACGPGRRVCP